MDETIGLIERLMKLVATSPLTFILAVSFLLNLWLTRQLSVLNQELRKAQKERTNDLKDMLNVMAGLRDGSRALAADVGMIAEAVSAVHRGKPP